jgi:hypothetical protein
MSDEEKALSHNDPTYGIIDNAEYMAQKVDPATIKDIEDTYGKCFSSSMGTLLSDGSIERNNNGDITGGVCTPQNLGPHNSKHGDLVFRWRLMKARENIINHSLDLQNPTEAASGGSSSSNNPGNISTTGYAFPLAPQTKAISGIVVGQTITSHHDGTPAFDLITPQQGADVYAIFGGTPTIVNTSFKPPTATATEPGCTSIMFHADDGQYYWYGHLMNPVVAEGTHIAAGTKMAQIADNIHFTRNCWEGTPHLHIDRGCSINGVPQPGGRSTCRDPAFIPFLSALYATLPG